MKVHKWSQIHIEEYFGFIYASSFWFAVLLKKPICVFVHCLQHKVYLVPKDQFTMEHIEPKVHCISTHGQFAADR